MDYMIRNHNCGTLNEKNIGNEVVINGWLNKRRDHGGLIFLDIRDRSGLVQVVVNPEKTKAFNIAQKLRSEFVVAVKGKVNERPKGTENSDLPSGQIEIDVDDLQILNKSEPLPFELAEADKVSEKLRLTYRFLDLRRKRMRENLELRHKVAKTVRNFLNDNGFLEIETPCLTKSTPEGARDFLVPSRLNPGDFYALPQSPQLFKQILMVSGFERYYQMARAFRDEDLRADRQPEHTQIDMELSFVNEADIITLAQSMLIEVFDLVGVKADFAQMKFEDAYNSYGSDKPDLRYGLKINDLTDVFKNSDFKVFSSAVSSGSIKGLKVEGGGSLSRSDLDRLTEQAIEFGAKGLVWMIKEEASFRSPIAKFLTEEELISLSKSLDVKTGDLLLILAGETDINLEVLGQLRPILAKRFDLIEPGFKFLTIVDFPLFTWDKTEGRLNSHHHPFTLPKSEYLDTLEEKPLEVIAHAYDMVVNGVEVGGGSLRIYDPKLQQRIFGLLGMTKADAEEKFGFLMNAFKFGAPPHGGIAFGLDRLVMLLSGSATIRDVIAFPKTQAGADLMTGAPDKVSKAQLKDLSLKADT